MDRRVRRVWSNAARAAMALTLSGCGSTNQTEISAPSGNGPLILSSPSLLPITNAEEPNADKLRALTRIVQNQTSAMNAYRVVRDFQQDRYYSAITAIEEALRKGGAMDNPTMLEHWRTAAHASQQIDLALFQLQGAFATYLPFIGEAQALSIPVAAILRGQQDAALDELQRQKGLMEFERQKLRALRQDIAQGLEPLPPLQPTIAVDNGATTPEESIDAPAAAEDEPGLHTGKFLIREATPEVKEITASPLAIIRFNRPNVVFRAQISDAIQRAKSATPKGRIHLVAVAPLRKTSQQQLLAQAESHQYAQSIRRAVQTLGIKPKDIRITAQTSKAVSSSEVHIYTDE